MSLVWTLPTQPNQTARWEEPSGGGGGSQPIVTGEGSPVGAVTPNLETPIYVATDTGSVYVATGDTSDDWIQVGGVSDLASFGLSFSDYAGGPTVLAQPIDGHRFAGLSDTGAMDPDTGSANGLFWQANADGEQILILYIGTGQKGFTWTAAGVMDMTSGAAGIKLPTSDPGISGVLWNNAGTPAISNG